MIEFLQTTWLPRLFGYWCSLVAFSIVDAADNKHIASVAVSLLSRPGYRCALTRHVKRGLYREPAPFVKTEFLLL